MPPLSRRALLCSTATGTALLAGCSALTPFGGGCGSGYSLEVTRLSDTELADTVTEEPRGEHAETATQLVDTAASEGEATYTTYHGAPLRAGIYVEHGGTYYRVERQVTATRELTARTVGIEYDEDETPPADATVVAFSDLPGADREAFLDAFPDEKAGRAEEFHGFSIGGYPHVYPEAADSRLADAGTVWVRYEGRTYAVTVGGTRTVEEETFRYTLETVARDREAFVAFVRERFVVALDDLSEGEREVFERATGDSISECEPLPEGFQALVDRLEAVPEDRRPRHGVWLATYEGATYEVELVQFVA